MKIKGYFDYRFKPKAPFIDAIVISSQAKLYHRIRFLIDSGASMTILLDKDVKDSGVDLSKLKRMKKGKKCIWKESRYDAILFDVGDTLSICEPRCKRASQRFSPI